MIKSDITCKKKLKGIIVYIIWIYQETDTISIIGTLIMHIWHENVQIHKIIVGFKQV